MKIIKDLTPINFSKTSKKKSAIVLHTALGSFAGTRSWFKNPIAKVSAHYVVGPLEGQIVQMVEDKDFAWHSGVIKNPSTRALKVMKKWLWGTFDNPNHYCIGIEFTDLEHGVTPEHLVNGAYLLKELIDDPKLNIPDDDDYIITHKDIAVYKPDIESLRNKLLKTLRDPSMIDREDIKKQIIELVQKL